MNRLIRLAMVGVLAFSMAGCQQPSNSNSETANTEVETDSINENEDNKNGKADGIADTSHKDKDKKEEDLPEVIHTISDKIEKTKEVNSGDFDESTLDNKMAEEDLRSKLELSTEQYVYLEGYESSDGKSLVVLVKPANGHELDCDKALTNYSVKKAEMKTIEGNEKNDFKEDEELVIPEHMMMVVDGTYVFALGNGSDKMVEAVVNTLMTPIKEENNDSDKDDLETNGNDTESTENDESTNENASEA